MTLTAYDRRDGGEDVQRLGFLKKTRIISSPMSWTSGWYV